MSDANEPTTIQSMDVSAKLERAYDFYRAHISGVAEAVGLFVIVVAAIMAVNSIGKSLFYDGAYNDGFEAGRASMSRDLGHGGWTASHQ